MKSSGQKGQRSCCALILEAKVSGFKEERPVRVKAMYEVFCADRKLTPEVQGHQLTMYHTMLFAFSSHKDKLHNLFAVLGEKHSGYKVSRQWKTLF